MNGIQQQSSTCCCVSLPRTVCSHQIALAIPATKLRFTCKFLFKYFDRNLFLLLFWVNLKCCLHVCCSVLNSSKLFSLLTCVLKLMLAFPTPVLLKIILTELKIRLNYVLFKFDAGASVQNFFNWWAKEAWKVFVANSSMFSFCPPPRRSKTFLIGTPWTTPQNSCVIPLEQDWTS